MSRLILASASPRRLALLEQIYVTPDLVVPADIDETPYLKEAPTDCAKRLAEAKARYVFQQYPEDFILAADTIVYLNGNFLPKAEDDNAVEVALRQLSNNKHRVITALSLWGPDQSETIVTSNEVAITHLSDQMIRRYLASKEGIGKAGGYAIQGLAASFVRQIVGSYSAIVGLPLYETAQLLTKIAKKS